MKRSQAVVPDSLLVANEFSSVVVVPSPHGVPASLTITSTITGRSISLDALELEALTLLSHRSFDELVLATVQSEHEDGTSPSAGGGETPGP